MAESDASSQPGRASRTLETPAVLIGLGEFGAGVAERLFAERAEALALDRGGLDPSAQDELGIVLARAGEPREDPQVATLAEVDLIASRTLELVRRALAHTRMVALRDANASENQSRLTILVFANLGEAEVREQLWPILREVQARLLAELGPIFEAYRTGRDRNGLILPLLAMPHPPSSPEGPALIECVHALVSAVAETPARRRAIPQLYLIEDVAEFSVLSEAELAQCVRNFATLLLYADLSGEAGADLVARLLHGHQPKEPLASFVCAVAELPRAKLAAYGRDRVALELLDAIRAAPRLDASLSEADALEQIEARKFERGDEAEKDVRAVLERYAPRVEPDPPPRWWEPSDLVRERYGPDPGDPSLWENQSPAAVPSGWLAERMRAIEETWRLLQRKRFDDVVARDRAAVERWRDELLAKLRERIDRELWQDPSPQALRRTEELVFKLRRAFAEQLDEAVRERDNARPAPPPDFEQLRSAHARMLDAARRKPDPPRMLLWGLLALIAVSLFLPPVLQMAAEALLLRSDHWLDLLLRQRPGWTSFTLGLLALGGWLGWTLGAAQLALLRALDRMWAALRDTIVGESGAPPSATGRDGSLLEYFTTRLRLSRAIARVESLLAVLASLDADAETLLLIDKAARRARGELRDHLRKLGVVLHRHEPDDISGLLGRGGETLVEPFVGEQGAKEIVAALPAESRESRVHDVLGQLARYYGRGDRWREELPFADLERLRRAAEPHAQPIATWDPFAGAERAEATAARLVGFVRRQRRSLRAALNFTGHESADASGIDRPFHHSGEAIVPRSAINLVRERAEADAEHLALRPGLEQDRAYYVVTATGIAEAAVASLRPIEGEEARP
ncbi:MAG: hypothetical protein R6X02_22840 [Enhygromyxa sp.]